MSYKLLNVKNEGRVELHDALGLSGAEISVNKLESNQNVPFVHSHKENEEIYSFFEGNGYVIIDETKVEVKKGDWLKISSLSKRQIFAGNEGLSYICIQVKENSLKEYTVNDAIIY